LVLTGYDPRVLGGELGIFVRVDRYPHPDISSLEKRIRNAYAQICGKEAEQIAEFLISSLERINLYNPSQAEYWSTIRTISSRLTRLLEVEYSLFEEYVVALANSARKWRLHEEAANSHLATLTTPEREIAEAIIDTINNVLEPHAS